ncbi:MAG: Rieske 2Fe-2S domain-containing protein [Chloroflexi bacterium]|nr:Rieske 2Fe-2S domain-containing protein [Chloroflexota bacterium]
MKFIVGKADEIPPGGRKIVRVEGRSIGVFNVDGEFYAIRNRCPHQGAPLCEGKLWGILKSDVPGQFEYSGSKEIIACISHGWEFSLKTGQSWCDPKRLRVRSYEVSVEDPDGIGPETPVAPADYIKNPVVRATMPPPVGSAPPTAASTAQASPNEASAADTSVSTCECQAAEVIANAPATEDPEAPAPGMVKGPYAVETYPVTIEDGYLYLVVDVKDVVMRGSRRSGHATV